MKTDNQNFISAFRNSAIGKKFAEELESSRVERKREALKSLAALGKTEAAFFSEFKAKQAEIADCLKVFEATELALHSAGAALFMAQRSADELRVEREREEATARREILKSSNPHVQPLLLEPLRNAIETSRTDRLWSESKFSEQHRKRGGQCPDQFFASKPAILARIAFLERASNLAYELIFNIADDGDNTLIAIREAIFAAAPSVEKMVAIPLTHDGARQATDQEITRAISQAEDLAAKHFGIALLEAK